MNRLTDLLALSHVPRWSIVPRIREQYVSDHVFRVIVIATELSDRLKLTAPTSLNACALILSALYHDAEESRTGDIPTPAKGKIGDIRPADYCPWLADIDLNADMRRALELADLIEAYTWLERWGVGMHKFAVLDRINRKIEDACPNDEWRRVARRVRDEITFDTGRGMTQE